MTSGSRARLARAVACCTLAACVPPALEPLEVEHSQVTILEFPLHTTPKLDVLFVIDRSPAMQPYVDTVVANLPHLVDSLGMSLHVGVVSSDLGATGARDFAPGPDLGTGFGACTGHGDAGGLATSELVDGAFIVDLPLTDGSHLTNYDRELGDALGSLADVRADGCTYSQPLEAMRRALRHPRFLREDAGLAVVFLLGGDDCSFAAASFTGGMLDASRCATRSSELVAVDEYAALLRSLKPPTYRLLTAALPTAPCGEATPRIDALFEQFPNFSRTTPICQPSLGDARPVFPSLGNPFGPNTCIESPLVDLDPARPGLQPWCAAELRQHGTFERLPACDEGPAPCWSVLEIDPEHCPTSFAMFHLTRPLLDLASDAYVRAQCLVEL